jgi:putative DNA primase/helicase
MKGLDPNGVLQAHGTDELRHQFDDARKFNGNGSGGKEANSELPLCSDEALALLFAEKHCGELRYTHTWGRWHRFDGMRWNDDATLLAFDHARHLCRAAAATVRSPSEKKEAASAKKRAAVISLAREDRRLAATSDQWDSDPYMLNTPAGVIDLRTHKQRPSQASDYFTKATVVAPAGDCPRWHQFLEEITGSDRDLAKFLQRVAGYALTGDTKEHSLFFLYGTGANGKSVFLFTLAGILGDYHRVAPIETFTASIGERHPTELAMLRGARLVTAIETEEGRRWAESRIKALTGGDRITARFMRQDFFEYTPQFKLLIAGNHKPSLRTVDEAIRRRFHLIPFTVTIPVNQRDPDLTETLKSEWPGILQWALDGCAAWRKDGLAPPEAVTKATAAYLEAEDAVSAWLEERCAHEGEDTLARLYASWRAWAELNGEHPRTNKWLSQALEARGFEPRKTKKGRQVLGLHALGANEPDGAWWDR